MTAPGSADFKSRSVAICIRARIESLSLHTLELFPHLSYIGSSDLGDFVTPSTTLAIKSPAASQGGRLG